MTIRFTPALALLATALPAVAATPQTTASRTSLQPVVVTATRTDVMLDDELAPVTVITAADIRRLQPVSLIDLLSGLPGVSLANSGGIGQQTSLFLRGTNSNQTLVLVDGVRVGSVSAGLPALEQIPVDQIARIEIVRGPRSSLYGADAIGGVIQIFTRHGTAGEGLRPSFKATVGSLDYRDGQIGLSGGTEHAWYNLSVGGLFTRGINSCKLGAGTVFAGCFTNEPDRDGTHGWNQLLSGGYRWDNGTELSGNVLHNRSFVAYDGSYQNQSRHAQQVAGIRLRLAPVGPWTAILTAGQNLDKATNYENGRYVGFGNSKRNQLGWQNDIDLGRAQQLTVGVDHTLEALDSSTAYVRTRRTDTGAYAQYLGRYGAEELQASLRRDHNSQFGGYTTGALAFGHHFGGGVLLSASWGTAFHAPTFNDLYYPSWPGFPPSSNPNLKPEKAHNFDVGLGVTRTHWNARVDAYQDTIDDLIVLNSQYTPGNLSRARIRGVEGQLNLHVANWRAHAYATWLDPRNRGGGANDSKLLPRRTRKSARLDLDRQFGAYSAGFTLAAFGPRFDDAANRHRLGGYTTLDLRGAWRFRPHWEVQTRLANVLDHRYETVYYYNQPGRTVYLSLRYLP